MTNTHRETRIEAHVEGPRALMPSVSVETIGLVGRACARAGFATWDELVAAARTGTLFRIDFASRRPANFVREFAEMIRWSGLALCADNVLEVFLGVPEALAPIIASGRGAPAVMLGELGHLAAQAGPPVAISGAGRSAGIRYERRAAPLELDGLNVLVLDDDAVSRKVITAMLKRAGSQVTAAGEAETAFAMLREAPPDLVVLDVVLGGALDGFQFCSAMRASARCAQVPAIFVTGQAEARARERADAVQASAFFEKPIQGAALRAAVSGLARRLHAVA